MRISSVLYILGKMLLYFSVILLTPVFVAQLDGNHSLLPFIYTFAITFLTAVVLVMFFKSEPGMTAKEGFLIVTLTWLAYAFFGCLPYLFDGTLFTLTDAFFESMSGFTTTGSTVITQIEGTSKAILFWRSLTQYLGGMGIIVLGIAILPEISLGAMQLFKAEVPGPTADRLYPRIKDTAMTLWVVYSILTIAEAVLLKIGGMTLFDAVNHAFTTMATGGFSTSNTSIAGYKSPFIEWVITFFMFMAGVNFTLHFHMLHGKITSYFKSSEFRTYLAIVLIGTLAVALNIHHQIGSSIITTIRLAAFQLVSILTTTGYASTDFELWPPFCTVILFLAMFAGAMAGSTGGGIKIVRLQLIFKHSFLQIRKLIHPQLVSHIKSQGRVVPEGVMSTVAGFLQLYIGIFIFAILIICACGIDFTTSLTAAAACLGNIGPGFGTVGAMDNFAHLPALVKNILSFLMLLGRLELYTVLAILLPGFWRD
ncbi:MAG: potassium transporter TrkG [Candidatus Margulisiibacteriota bacterium]